MIIVRGLITLLIFLMAVMSCTEPYSPPVSSEAVHALVVDGLLNTQNSTASVLLSRAVSLSSQAEPPGETGAIVTVEEKGGAITTLKEVAAGSYSANIISSNQKQYRLHVTTRDGKKYMSDYVTAYQAPPIDSLFWNPATDGISIVVNAHDPTEQTQYYRWTFTETWKYFSPYSPGLILRNGVLVPYTPAVSLSTCWMTVPSHTILIYSTTAFKENRVSQFPITFIDASSQRLGVRYSIEVTQQAISQDEYNFWQQLQSTTQSLGGLFDALPSQVTGNIQDESDGKEPVLGNFTAGSYTSKRIFIDHYDLPRSLQVLPDYSSCALDSIPANQISVFADGSLFVSSYGVPFTKGYTTTTTECMDCRTQGGTITRPPFWK